jgi:hypothetical protein
VSGSGLENIYWAWTRLHNEQHTPLSAAEIFAMANDNSDSLASECVQLFFEMLGQIAGDIALTLGAENGNFYCRWNCSTLPHLLANVDSAPDLKIRGVTAHSWSASRPRSLCIPNPGCWAQVIARSG